MAVSLALYYIVPIKLRPKVLLVASLIFYLYSGLDNALFLMGVILLTYFTGLVLGKISKNRKVVLALYVVITVGLLVFIKFINYALNLGAKLFNFNSITLSVLVPLGISFFMLQAIGYVIDVYRGKNPPEKNIFNFALFMSYFPIIVQGPIIRYNDFKKELSNEPRFNYKGFKFGLQLAGWGVFKKLVIANRAALFADVVFMNYNEYSGLVVVCAVLLYTLQIYADFSGCVDICRGVSEMFGIKLMNNFDHPYFAVSIKDFWRRWHISLSSFLRDYVYISLGGNRKGKLRKNINLIVTFLVSGLWHGVGIHYIIWGLYHAICQIIGDVTRKPKDKLFKFLKVNTFAFSFRLGQRIITFLLICYSWLLFRATGTVAAYKMTLSIFKNFIDIGALTNFFGDGKDLAVLLISVLILLLVSLIQRKFNIRKKIANQNLWFRWTLYLLFIFSIIIFGIYGKQFNASDFLYMQF